MAEVLEMKGKGPYVSSSAETSGNPEAGLMNGSGGDTQNDLADMMRLGKKQEFKVSFTFILSFNSHGTVFFSIVQC
jgi:hypothetical protein